MSHTVKAIEAYLDQYTVQPNLVGDTIHSAHFKGDVGAEIRLSHLRAVVAEVKQLRECLSWALEYIDAIPSESAAKFPTMPGFDRDYVNGVLAGLPPEGQE